MGRLRRSLRAALPRPPLPAGPCLGACRRKPLSRQRVPPAQPVPTRSSAGAGTGTGGSLGGVGGEFCVGKSKVLAGIATVFVGRWRRATFPVNHCNPQVRCVASSSLAMMWLSGCCCGSVVAVLSLSKRPLLYLLPSSSELHHLPTDCFHLSTAFEQHKQTHTFSPPPPPGYEFL